MDSRHSESSVSILFQFRQSRKPMTLDLSLGEEALNPVQDELRKFDSTIYLPLMCDESPSNDAKPYTLQRWSTMWQEYVNIISAIEIGDGDKLLAVPEPRSSDNTQATSGHSVSCQTT